MIYFQALAALVELGLVLALAGVCLEAAQRPASSPSLARRRLGEGLIYLSVFVFIASGLSKLVHVPLAVKEMGLLGLTGARYLLVAGVEITSGVLLLVRPLRSIALLFVSAHVGGAICAHLIAGQYFAILPSAIVLSLCWLGMFLRYPQILWSLGELALARRRPAGRLRAEART